MVTVKVAITDLHVIQNYDYVGIGEVDILIVDWAITLRDTQQPHEIDGFVQLSDGITNHVDDTRREIHVGLSPGERRTGSASFIAPEKLPEDVTGLVTLATSDPVIAQDQANISFETLDVVGATTCPNPPTQTKPLLFGATAAAGAFTVLESRGGPDDGGTADDIQLAGNTAAAGAAGTLAYMYFRGGKWENRALEAAHDLCVERRGKQNFSDAELNDKIAKYKQWVAEANQATRDAGGDPNTPVSDAQTQISGTVDERAAQWKAAAIRANEQAAENTRSIADYLNTIGLLALVTLGLIAALKLAQLLIDLRNGGPGGGTILLDVTDQDIPTQDTGTAEPDADTSPDQTVETTPQAAAEAVGLPQKVLTALLAVVGLPATATIKLGAPVVGMLADAAGQSVDYMVTHPGQTLILALLAVGWAIAVAEPTPLGELAMAGLTASVGVALPFALPSNRELTRLGRAIGL